MSSPTWDCQCSTGTQHCAAHDVNQVMVMVKVTVQVAQMAYHIAIAHVLPIELVMTASKASELGGGGQGGSRRTIRHCDLHVHNALRRARCLRPANDPVDNPSDNVSNRSDVLRCDDDSAYLCGLKVTERHVGALLDVCLGLPHHRTPPSPAYSAGVAADSCQQPSNDRTCPDSEGTRRSGREASLAWP